MKTAQQLAEITPPEFVIKINRTRLLIRKVLEKIEEEAYGFEDKARSGKKSHYVRLPLLSSDDERDEAMSILIKIMKDKGFTVGRTLNDLVYFSWTKEPK